MRQILEDGAKAMGVSLSQRQLEQFERYYELLVMWNEKMNLTAITQQEEVAVKHFLDSLAGWKELYWEQNKAPALIDVGTGAGFPGLPLKIAFPDVRLTLLDSLQKRVGFLQEVTEQLGLAGVRCLHGRAEEAAHEASLREHFDVAMARAVAPLPVLLEYCSGYVRRGGAFLAYKGPGIEAELAESQRAMRELRLQYKKTLKATLPGDDLDHFVAVFEKIGNLSLKYPRKQSKIKKEKLV